MNEGTETIGDATPPIRRREALVVLGLLLAAFLAVKLGNLGYSRSDENLYFHMGKLTAEGTLPYRDFRFAHPPLRLVPPALVFAFAGFSITLLKLLPVMAGLATAAFLFLVVRRLADDWTAVAGTALFLFSYSGLFCTSYYMGTNLTTALLMGGFWQLTGKKDAGAGICFGLALLTGLYAGPPVAAAGIYLAVRERKRLKTLLWGTGGVFLAGQMVGLGLGGAGFLEQTWLYHIRKEPGIGMSNLATVWTVVLRQPEILAGAFFYPFFRKAGLDLLFLAGVLFCAGFLAAPIFQQYDFVLAAPFLAAAAGATLTGLVGKLRLSSAATVLLVLLTLSITTARNYGEYLTTRADDSLPQAEDMAKMVTDLTPPGAPVFGMQSVAPLVALLADRPILNHHLDTDGLVYLSGIDDLDEEVAALAPGPPVMVITHHRMVDERSSIFYGPMVYAPFRELVQTRMQVVFTWMSARDPSDRIVFHLPPMPGAEDGR